MEEWKMVTVARDNDVQIEKLQLGPFDTNAYIVTCRKTRESVLVDTPAEANTIIKKLKGTTPRYILLTHNHMDHLGAFSELRSGLKVPVAAHSLDSGNLLSPPEIMLHDSDTVSFGNVSMAVIHTPGHTPGSLCFRIGRYLLSGDTLFPGGPGRTGSPDAFKQITRAIKEKLLVLPDDTQVYPGHGDSTLLKKEKEEFAAFLSKPHQLGLCGSVLWLSS